MHSLRSLSSVVAAVGLLSFCSAGSAAAFGGGPGTGTGSGAGASSGGGGGHGASVSASSAGSGHSGMSSGLQSGVSGRSPAFHSMGATYNGAPRYLPGGYTPNGSGRLSTAGRPASQFMTSRAVFATQGAGRAVPVQSRAVVASRPTNAWTDTGITGVKAADRQANLYAANQSNNAYRNNIANGNYNGLTTPDGIAGTYLYPGVYGSTLNNFYNAQSPRGAYATNGVARNFAQEQRWYGPDAGYHPYWPNGYIPYFGGYGYPFFGSAFGFGSYGDYDGSAGLTNDNAPGNNDQSVATVDSGPAPAGQQAGPAPADSQNPPNAAPAQPANPDARAASGTLSNGPDSLIEAVQAELARRGYFSGKVDAMYGPTTREALRRFQTDAGLAATGRINEATMHALELD